MHTRTDRTIKENTGTEPQLFPSRCAPPPKKKTLILTLSKDIFPRICKKKTHCFLVQMPALLKCVSDNHTDSES